MNTLHLERFIYFTGLTRYVSQMCLQILTDRLLKKLLNKKGGEKYLEHLTETSRDLMAKESNDIAAWKLFKLYNLLSSIIVIKTARTFSPYRVCG